MHTFKATILVRILCHRPHWWPWLLYSAGHKFRTFYVMTFLWPPWGRGANFEHNGVWKHPLENVLHSSFRVKLCLQVNIASHQKLTPKKIKIKVYQQFQSLPIPSRVARKKIPFKCAKLLTKTVEQQIFVCRKFPRTFNAMSRWLHFWVFVVKKILWEHGRMSAGTPYGGLKSFHEDKHNLCTFIVELVLLRELVVYLLNWSL